MTSKPVSQTNTLKHEHKMASNQSLNHLLNFTLPPRQTRPPVSIPRRSRRTGTGQGVWNKERFVNAHYRFVMNPTGDYTVHFAEPDIFFQWQDILQVIIPRSSALASAAASGEQSSQEEGFTNCPICLSPPTAPRMTKCGHVFCFPCILHYLNISENKWARCPICFDSVNEYQLKSVKWYDGPVRVDDDGEATGAEASSSASVADCAFESAPRAGSTLRMRLIQRPQITTLALPRSHTWPSDLLPPHQAPFHFLPDVFSFSKFMLATPTYLVSNLSIDLDELASERRILSGMSDDLGIMFVENAEQKVKHQIAKALALETPALKRQIDKAHHDQRELEERIALNARRRKLEEDAHTPVTDIPEEFLASKTGYISTPPSVHEAAPKQPAPIGRNPPRQRKNVNPPPPSTSTYYYYQAASGLPLFLHPIDIRILLSHFKGYSEFPDTITIRVESFAEGTVNDDLRKRCKYLGHMPEGADVVFIEADLEGVVGAEGLKNFEGPLKMRTARRKEKGRKDDRARARAEEREREKDHSVIPWAAADVIPSSQIREDPVEDFSAYGEQPSAPPVTSQPRPELPGAWGARSFASALHSPSTPRSAPSRAASGQQRAGQRDLGDEFDMDIAWHELEQRSGGGQKKRGTRLVVLGSGGGARRR